MFFSLLNGKVQELDVNETETVTSVLKRVAEGYHCHFLSLSCSHHKEGDISVVSHGDQLFSTKYDVKTDVVLCFVKDFDPYIYWVSEKHHPLRQKQIKNESIVKAFRGFDKYHPFVELIKWDDTETSFTHMILLDKDACDIFRITYEEEQGICLHHVRSMGFVGARGGNFIRFTPCQKYGLSTTAMFGSTLIRMTSGDPMRWTVEAVDSTVSGHGCPDLYVDDDVCLSLNTTVLSYYHDTLSVMGIYNASFRTVIHKKFTDIHSPRKVENCLYYVRDSYFRRFDLTTEKETVLFSCNRSILSFDPSEALIEQYILCPNQKWLLWENEKLFCFQQKRRRWRYVPLSQIVSDVYNGKTEEGYIVTCCFTKCSSALIVITTLDILVICLQTMRCCRQHTHRLRIDSRPKRCCLSPCGSFLFFLGHTFSVV